MKRVSIYVFYLCLPPFSDWDGFILDEKELIPTARETWEGVRVVAEAVLDRILTGKSTTPKGL